MQTSMQTSSRQHRVRNQRKRAIEYDSDDDDESMQLVMAHSRADQRRRARQQVRMDGITANRAAASYSASFSHARPGLYSEAAPSSEAGPSSPSQHDEGIDLVMHIYALAMAERGASQQVQRNTASRAVASLVDSSSPAAPEITPETAPEMSSQAAAAAQPGVELEVHVERTCPICMDDCDGEPRGRPDPQEHMRGWGYTSCCGSSFHFECMSTWLLDTDTVESTNGPVPLPSNCPHCRSNRLAPTSSRMLQGTKG